MNIPPKTKPQWAEMVSGKKVYALKFLAAKILLGRLIRSVEIDPSEINIRNSVDQLHGLYENNATAPSAVEDMKTIFG